jgi:2'-5' RNA ligase
LEASYERTRYVLVIRVPREVEICLEDRFLGLLGTTKPVMGYHITLVGSFFVPGDVAPDSLTGIHDVCRRWRPFHVEMNGLGSFAAAGGATVFMHVLPQSPLPELQRELVTILAPQIEYVSQAVRDWNVAHYRPHVTLGLGLDASEYEALQRAAADGACRAEFEATVISLAAKEPNGPWQHVATFPLGLSVLTESD